MRNNSLNDFWFHVAALAMVAVWAISFLNTRVLLDAGLHPVEIFVARFTIAYLVLLALSRFRITMASSVRDELLLAVCGMCGGSVYFIAENTALEYTLISDVAIIVCVAPVLTALIGAFFYRDERVTPMMAVGSLIAFAGTALLALRDGWVWGDSVLGDVLAMLAALSWAVYALVLKRLNHSYGTLFITRKSFFYGIITALPVLALSDTPSPLAVWKQPAVWGNVLYLGLVCSMAAYSMWNIAVKRIGAVRASNYIYLSPLISMIAAAVWFGERANEIAYVGCAMILAGVIIAEKFKRTPINHHARRH